VEESERVLTMLTALMDITEAEAGVMRLKVEPTSIAALLKNVVELYEIVAEEKQIMVTTDFQGPCEALVDATRMRQALANLLDNALKYTPAGGQVWLACTVESGRVTVRVRDNGMGIAPEHYDQIFEVFRRLHGEHYEGLGIGLAICKRLVERYGGRIWLDSELGVGSTFYFTLRAAEKARVAGRS